MGLDEKALVDSVRNLCGIHLKSRDVAKVADALGMRPELQTARKAEAAEYQHQERGIALGPRSIAARLWGRGLPCVASCRYGAPQTRDPVTASLCG
mmetsp:Transcript_3830/g.9055  ORF Transcript_3830/g.9055 Transcript_3830/m.9055 type:complete len:96 (-) Transcript_3830:441-728(-)